MTVIVDPYNEKHAIYAITIEGVFVKVNNFYATVVNLRKKTLDLNRYFV